MSELTSFEETQPDLESYWDAIIFNDVDINSFKWPLAQSILRLVEEKNTKISYNEFSKRYLEELTRYIKESPNSIENSTCTLIRYAKEYLENKIAKEIFLQYIEEKEIVNLLRKFHIVNLKELPLTFFDFQADKRMIILNENIKEVNEIKKKSNKPSMCPNRRDLIGSKKSVLLKTQGEKCFYCGKHISGDYKEDGSAVDHYFPFVLQNHFTLENKNIKLNKIWNLVFSCKSCNAGDKNSKNTLVPVVRHLVNLYNRNEKLINDPLLNGWEDEFYHVGKNKNARHDFLQEMDDIAIKKLIHRWDCEDMM